MPDLPPLAAAVSGLLAAQGLRGVGIGWADPAQTYALRAGEVLAAAAVEKRRAEFSAGRHAARMAMGQVAAELADMAVPLCADRSPLWPAGLCGSISHSSSACLAVAARLHDCAALGLDVEDATPLDPTLWEVILRPDDTAHLGGQTAGHTAKVIFSVKEACYKALYPQCQQVFGFSALRVDLGQDGPTGGPFTATLCETVSGLALGLQIRGQWRQAQGHVLSVAAIPAAA